MFRQKVRGDLWNAAALWTVPPWQRPVRSVAKVALYANVRAVVWFRLSQWLWTKPVLRPLSLLIQAHTLKISGAELHPAAAVGAGFGLGHSAGVVIGARTTLGENVTVFQGVTLGDAHSGRDGQPTIGDFVVIGAGAKVLGPVHVGARSRIGANSVVLDDVPSGATVVGTVRRRQ